MSNIASDTSVHRSWIVCEAGKRWLNTVRRFAPEQMPKPLVAVVLPGEPETVQPMLADQAPAIVLWSVQRDSMVAAADNLAEISTAAPGILQLVASEGLTPREIMILSEFGAATTISRPEDLPRLTPMIHGYFASARHHLDY